MGLEGNLRNEYSYLKSNAKRRVNEYELKVSELNKKIELEKEKYTKGKYKFFKTINEELLEKARETRKNKNLVRDALNKCNKLMRVSGMSYLWSSDNQFWNLEQYENIDWKHKINFGKASLNDADELRQLKKNDQNTYMASFQEYIREFEILQEIENIVKNNFYIKNRVQIINTAIQLFTDKKYIPFVYLMVPQVEGLFDIYKDILGIGINKTYRGFCEKLEDIYSEKRIWGYVYYAYDFPQLRNDIAHGKIIDVDEETACDILMDISKLMNEIDSEELIYKVVLDFFKNLSGTNKEDKILYILEYFSAKGCYHDRNISWLNEYIAGNHNELIEWYKMETINTELIEIIGSDAFRRAIFNNEPLIIYEEAIIEQQEFKIKIINDKVLDYIPMLEVIKKKYSFPKQWDEQLEKRLLEVNEENENKIQVLEKYLATLIK